jgi:hypothetical protein
VPYAYLTVVVGRFQTVLKRCTLELEAGRFMAGRFSTLFVLGACTVGFLKAVRWPLPVRTVGGASLSRQAGFSAFARTRDSQSQPVLSQDRGWGLKNEDSWRTILLITQASNETRALSRV